VWGWSRILEGCRKESERKQAGFAAFRAVSLWLTEELFLGEAAPLDVG